MSNIEELQRELAEETEAHARTYSSTQTNHTNENAENGEEYDEDDEMAKVNELDAVLAKLTLAHPISLLNVSLDAVQNDSPSQYEQYLAELKDMNEGNDDEDDDSHSRVFITAVQNSSSNHHHGDDNESAAEYTTDNDSVFDIKYFEENPYRMTVEESSRLQTLDSLIAKLKKEEKDYRKKVKERLDNLNDDDLLSTIAAMTAEEENKIPEEKQRDREELRLPQLFSSYDSRPSTSASRPDSSSSSVAAHFSLLQLSTSEAVRPLSSPGF